MISIEFFLPIEISGATGGGSSFCLYINNVCTLGFQSVCEIADFRDVFTFYAYFTSVAKLLRVYRAIGVRFTCGQFCDY